MTEKLSLTYVRVDALRPNPWNPNRQDDETMERERRSIRDHGFVDPITVRDADGETPYEIIDGEHRWRAARDLGIAEVPLVNLGKVSDARARKLTVLLNELRGRPDTIRLAELLRSLDQDAESLSRELPYSPVEIESLVRSMDDFGWGEKDVLNAAPAVAQKKGAAAGDVRFMLGNLKAWLPKEIAREVIAEWERTSDQVGSRDPVAVFRSWLGRLRPAVDA